MATCTVQNLIVTTASASAWRRGDSELQLLPHFQVGPAPALTPRWWRFVLWLGEADQGQGSRVPAAAQCPLYRYATAASQEGCRPPRLPKSGARPPQLRRRRLQHVLPCLGLTATGCRLEFPGCQSDPINTLLTTAVAGQHAQLAQHDLSGFASPPKSRKLFCSCR